MTKSITALAALKLQEEGLLSLRDPVSKYIPSFSEVKVVRKKFRDDPHVTLDDERKVERPARPMTLADLVLHTSGLGYGPGAYSPEQKRIVARTATEKAYRKFVIDCEEGVYRSSKEYADALAKIPLRSHPGERYTYSFGVDILGRVIEVVSGQPLEVYFRRHVFKPLGMRDVAFALPKKSARKLAAYYHLLRAPVGTRVSRSQRVLRRFDGKRPESSAWVRGSATNRTSLRTGGGFFGLAKGGLLFSLRDVAMMTNMLVNEGRTWCGKPFLRPSTVKSLSTDWLAKPWVSGRSKRRPLPGFENTDIGWSPIGHVQLEGDHPGALFMGGTGYWWADPKRRLAAVTLSESYWMVPAAGWKAPEDDIEAVVMRSVASFEKKRAERASCKRRSTSSTRSASNKRKRQK